MLRRLFVKLLGIGPALFASGFARAEKGSVTKLIRHEYTEDWSFERLELVFAEESRVWVAPFDESGLRGLLQYKPRRGLEELPLMAFAPEHEDGVQERVDALYEMNDGHVDVHFVEVQMPEEKIYGFFAVEPGVRVLITPLRCSGDFTTGTKTREAALSTDFLQLPVTEEDKQVYFDFFEVASSDDSQR